MHCGSKCRYGRKDVNTVLHGYCRGGGWFCFDDDLIFKLKTVVESVNVWMWNIAMKLLSHIVGCSCRSRSLPKMTEI